MFTVNFIEEYKPAYKERKKTTFYLDPINFEKWKHQNGVEYYAGFIDGCLLDNFVVMTKRGFAAFYECYVNPNYSRYYVEFQKDAAQDVFRTWYKFEEENQNTIA